MSPKMLDLYVLTLNCAHNPIDIPSFSSTLFAATSHLPDLLVISLQEISPLSHGLIGGSLLSPYLTRIEEAVEIAAQNLLSDTSSAAPSLHASKQPRIYTNVATRNIGITAIMAFARDGAAIRDLQGAEVGVGISAMGNKGAVGLRFTYADAAGEGAETELTFVAAHLAAMEWDMERRNRDWESIVRGLVFAPAVEDNDDEEGRGRKSTARGEEDRPLLEGAGSGEGLYKATSHLFLAGDLNYRTSSTKPGGTAHADEFPQPHHVESDPQHYSHLLKHDQLTQERLAGRTCHGLVEAPITFPPTYKYELTPAAAAADRDVWAWAPHRWPSWTDRILFLDTPAWLRREQRTAQLQVREYAALPLSPTTDHRGVALSVGVPLVRIPAPGPEDEGSEDPRVSPPYEVDAGWRAKRAVARKEELFVGWSGFVTGTWEGRCGLIGTVAGLVGAFFLLRAAWGV